MANRSYLYATQAIPDRAAGSANRVVKGISEWNYAIPLCYRLLVSVDTVACPSLIWDKEGDLALAGDYAGGVARLRDFLGQIDWPEAEPLVREAETFLDASQNRAEYFVLECAELFAMGDEPLTEQNAALLEGLGDIDTEVQRTLAHLSQVKPSEPGLVARMLGLKPANPLAPIEELGLGHWSNVLYFDLSED